MPEDLFSSVIAGKLVSVLVGVGVAVLLFAQLYVLRRKDGDELWVGG